MGHDSWHVSVRRRIIALFVALATLLAGGIIAATATATASAATTSARDSYSSTVGNSTFEAARSKYGLAKEMRDGATLHAFEWSFKTIEENIPDIAAAGYTSVQTEPIQKIKDNRKLGTGNWYLNWYYVYQPVDMSIGNYVVGSEDDFKELCDVAHKYGVRIIVDVVANHFTSDFDVIADRWRNKSYFHEDKQISDYNNREDCTQHKLSGLWDLNTQDATVTQGMADLLKQMVADGADGFRYDAAKHIELPDEVFGGKTSNYWNTILQNGAQYQYGEVLEDANVREADYADLFWNSSTGKGGITDSSFGHEVRNGVQHGSLSASHFTQHNKVTEDKTVNWVESHDNFANGEANIPQELTDEWIKYGWAGITAQKNGMTLFFDRPYKDGGTYGTGGKGTYGNGSGPFTENSKLGDAGDDLWKDPEVVAVNHFRNAMVGEDSNVSNCGDEMCLMVERYAGSSAQDGVVVANANGSDKSLAGTSTKLASGTYTDEVTGTTLTVSGGTITSGTVKAKSVAAFSNKTRNSIISTAEAYPNKGTIPGTSKTITLRAFQATNTSYTTSDGQSGSYVDGDTVKIGASAKKGDVLTVTVTGTGANGETIKHTYSYTKQGDPTYDPSDGTRSPCDKYCVTYMEKNGYDPDKYIDSQETNYEGGTGVDATGVSISGDGVSNGAVSRDISGGNTTLKLTATVTPSNASQRVTWSSSDTSVASVASDGTVTFKKAGTATITAKANSGSASASITATVTGEAPKATNVIYATMPSGWNGTLYVYMYSGSGSGTTKNAAWPGVAMTKVDSSDDCANAGTYKYEVPDSLASSAKVIFTNSSNQYPGSGADGMSYTGGTVSWTSGQTSLTTATCSGGTTVVAVSGVSVSPSSVSLSVGGSQRLSAVVSPSNASDKSVSWSSSDPSVATVSSDGVVKAVKAGSVTVTAASSNGKSASAMVLVKGVGPAQRFSDVPAGAVFHDDIEAMADKGVMRGANGRFGYSDTVKRSDLAAFLYRLAVADGVAGAASYVPSDADYAKFSDVGRGTMFAKEILWLASVGVIRGANGRFGYSDTVRRSDLAAFLYRLAVAEGASGAASFAASAADYAKFSDVGEGTVFAKEVLWLSSVGVIRGANGRFGYSDTVRRSDLAAFLNRYDSQVLSASTAFSVSGPGVSGGKLSLSVGKSVQLSAVNVPSGASTVTWWSDGAAVAVTGTGRVLGVKAGVCSVHVQAGDSTAVLKVTVK